MSQFTWKSSSLQLTHRSLQIAAAILVSAGLVGISPAQEKTDAQNNAVPAEDTPERTAENTIGDETVEALLQQQKAMQQFQLVQRGKKDASPQEKAVRAAETAQRQQAELVAQQQQMAAEEHARAEQDRRKALEAYQKILDRRLLLEQQLQQLEAQRTEMSKQIAIATEAAEVTVRPQQSQIDPASALLKRELQELESRRAQLAAELASRKREKLGSDPASAVIEEHLKYLEVKQAELAADLASRQQQDTSLPKDSTFKVFSLRNSKAPDAARVLSQILGGSVARMAIDERTNSLLVYADKDTAAIVEELLLRLDEPAESATEKKAQPGETLQLRIVWLLDINEGIEPTDKLVSPQVVEALRELGFTDPKVVCQQVTTLTLSDDGGRRGQFNFAVPVLIKSQPWQLEGQGQIESMADERFNLRFDLNFQQVNSDASGGFRGGGRGPGQRSQLGGSINTPLGHYTVMGTTTFVGTTVIPRPPKNPSEKSEIADGGAESRGAITEVAQHLSAFVVYLDRAREFPASEAPSKN